LSGQALTIPLTKIDSSGSLTVGDFLSNPEMVYDLIANVPRLINGQYVELRRSGHLTH
jgi:hypothetical protein